MKPDEDTKNPTETDEGHELEINLETEKKPADEIMEDLSDKQEKVLRKSE